MTTIQSSGIPNETVTAAEMTDRDLLLAISMEAIAAGRDEDLEALFQAASRMDILQEAREMVAAEASEDGPGFEDPDPDEEREEDDADPLL